MTYKTGSWGEQAKARSKRRTAYFIAWRKKNPQKWYAHRQVAYALKIGKLIKKPCKKCGSLKVEAHHNDYNFPLKVIWFCPKHHRQHDGRELK